VFKSSGSGICVMQEKFCVRLERAQCWGDERAFQIAGPWTVRAASETHKAALGVERRDRRV
jgi:hypothetical protein